MKEVTLYVPVKTVTESNTGGHWATKARRARSQKNTVALSWMLAAAQGKFKGTDGIPTSILLTRVAMKRVDDDNLPGALKHVRDQIVTMLGRSQWTGQGDEQDGWFAYSQRKGVAYAVEIVLQWSTGEDDRKRP